MLQRARLLALLTVAVALAPAVAWAQPPYLSELVGFNGDPNHPIDDPATSQEMFRIPEWSGSTVNYILLNAAGTYGNNAAYRAAGMQTEGAAALQVFFRWRDPVDPGGWNPPGDPNAWVRLTTFGGTLRPNPALHLGGKVRFKITNRSGLFDGEIGLVLGVRETGVAVPQLANGGTTGDIEWVGVSEAHNAIMAGLDRIVNSTAAGDDVQVYPVGTNLGDPNDPNNPPLIAAVITPGPDGVLQSVTGGDDQYRYGFYSANGARRPIPVVTFPPAPDAVAVEFDLATGDVKLTTWMGSQTYPGGIVGFTGDGVLSSPNMRGTLEHIAITKVAADPGQLIDFAIDELQFEAPDPDPVIPPRIVEPIINADPTIGVTGLIATADRVRIYRDGVEILDVAASPPTAVINVAGIVTGQVYTATQHDSITGVWSDPSPPVTVLPFRSPYQFSIAVDENGNNCESAAGSGWEFVPVTAVDSGPAPRGVNLFPNDAIWQTIDIPLDNDDLVVGWSGQGGNGALDPSPTGVYSIDSFWWVQTAGNTFSGPHEVLMDAIEALDANDQVLTRIQTMEGGTIWFPFARGQSTDSPTTNTTTTAGSYDGLASHRFVWDYGTLDTNQTLGMYHSLGGACNTTPTFPDTAVKVRVRMVCRAQPTAAGIALPTVVGPIIRGTQSTVRVNCNPTATALQLYIDGAAVGTPVDPNGASFYDFTGLTLAPGQSVSAKQTLPAGESDFAYPRGVNNQPLPPKVNAPLLPNSTSVTVTGCSAALYATASLVTVYVNGVQAGTGVPTNGAATVTVPALVALSEVKATQTVNGAASAFSAPVIVSVPSPTITYVPNAGITAIRVQDIDLGATQVKIIKNGTDVFTAVPDPAHPTWVEVPVTGLVAGDTVTVRQTAFGTESADSPAETVSVGTITTVFCDHMDSYADQTAFEAVWPRAVTAEPALTLDPNMNATIGGSKSALAPAGQPPGGTGWTWGYQSKHYQGPFDANDATQPLVWSVNIYDAGGSGANDARQWAELRDYTAGTTVRAIVALGMPGDDFVIGGGDTTWDLTRYHARVYGGAGAPGWINLNHPGAPLRTPGWHTLTAVIKVNRVDVYVDGVLARKNQVRGTYPYDTLYIGSGYEGLFSANYDDFCVTKGRINFPALPPQPPAAPRVASPVQRGDTVVTVADIVQQATRVDVYANGAAIGFVTLTPPNTTGTVAVPVTPLVYQQLITAKQTNSIGQSQASPALEVGKGNGDVLLTLGIRETGDTGALGSPGSGTGAIEWIGAGTATGGAPQGKPITPGYAWQTVTFNPATDPKLSYSGGNGVIDGTRGTLEHLAVAVDAASAGRSTGAYRLYIDNVVNVGAGPSGADFVLTGFEGYTPGVEVLFQEPTYSGPTSANLSIPPSGSSVSNAYAKTGTQSQLLTWFYKDTTAQRWARITTSGTANVANPIIDLTKPIRMDVLLIPAPTLMGDSDGDGDIDMIDFNAFRGCLLGAWIPIQPTCAWTDFNFDGRIDMYDFAEFQASFTR